MQLKMYLQFLKGLSESTDDYLYLWDIKQELIWIFGGVNLQYNLCEDGQPTCTLEEFIQIVYPNDVEILQEDLYRIRIGESEIHNLDYRFVDRSGEVVWISCRGTMQRDSKGKPAMLVGRISDTAFKHKVDSLTRMFNKVKMSEDLEQVLATEEQGYLVLLGVDDLKNINIRNGRSYGNEVLKRVGKTLEDVIGNPQRVYRLDGDCFAVRIYDDSQLAVSNMYQQIKKRLAGICTMSAGAVAYRMLMVRDADILYQYAEDAMDRAKKSGKNNLVFFSAADYEKKLADIKLIEEIRNSVQNGCEGFCVFYQPQVEEHTYRIFGAEALLRYDSPNRGRVVPGDFIPILEKTGMIREVGLWVLKTALQQCKIWRQTKPDFHISVNVSYVQLEEEDIAEKVLKVLDESDLPGEALTLEVTESMQLQDYPYYNRIFYQWKKSGIVISVDDFGTGYSSLGYLKSLKIDEIKIDRCFVSGIQASTYNYRLLSNVLELAHGSKIRVCCEGIEEEDEVKTLEELNPDLLQGFFFARPCDKEEFEAMYIFTEKPEYYAKLQLIKQLQREGKILNIEQLTQHALETIVDTLDEIVMISDMNTYELLYMNHAACSLTGVYDYKGKKCYKVLQGTNAPCEFCNNASMRKDAFSEWRKSEEGWRKNFILKSKCIDWNGRAAHLEVGVDISGHLDCLLNMQQSDILSATDLGLWVIRMDESAGRYEMYADDTMHRIMAFEKGGTPEECYMHWYSRINDGYYNYVHQNVEKMIQSGKVVQSQYTWNHPYLGEVQVRCTGIRTEDMDGMVCMKGYYRIISSVEQSPLLVDEPSNEIFEYNEKKNSIYFHTPRVLIAGEEMHENAFPDVWIQNRIVHPNFHNKFKELFCDVLQTKDDVKGVELMLRDKTGEYSWFKMDIRRLGGEARDRNTMVVQLHASNQERVMELENLRIRDFYHASLSETLAYAELDLESGYAHEVGGLWEEYNTIARTKKISLLEYFAQLQMQHENDLDAVGYLRNYEEILKQGKQTKRFTYTRMIEGEERLVELVIHTFKEQFSENMYALVYLKDIDVDKK